MKMRGASAPRRRPRPRAATTKRAWPLDDRAAAPCRAASPRRRARASTDTLSARALTRCHVDADGAVDRHAVVGGAPREMRGIGAGDQRLGRHAAGVDAGAAEQLALDERDRHAGRGQPAGKRRAGLAGADDDRVEGRLIASAATIRRRRTIATASSMSAAGRSLRRSARRARARAARPPSVPMTAPTMPATSPATSSPPRRADARRPQSAPIDDARAELHRHRAARRGRAAGR